MKDTQLLARTPAQFPLESPAGYLQRLAEANGCFSPLVLLDVAGMGRIEGFTPHLAVDKLAPLIGEHSTSLHGYGGAGAGHRVSFSVCGVPLQSRDLRVSTSKICPVCILERSYAPAWLDLAAVDACPVHRRKLLTRCAACGSKLRRTRPGLLRCHCSADLSLQAGEAIAEDHAALLKCLAAKLGEPAKGCDDDYLLDNWLQSMSLMRLLRVIGALAALHRGATKQEGASDAQRAARLLANWPGNAHVALWRLLPKGERTSGTGAMLEHAPSIYRAWLRGVTDPVDVAMLRQMLAGFRAEATAQALTDISVAVEDSGEPSSRWASNGASPLAAERHPLDVAAYDGPAGGGARVAPAVRYDDRRDAPRARPVRSVQIAAVSPRDAARRLGLPVSVLDFLRRHRLIGQGSYAGNGAAYPLAALVALDAQIAAVPVVGRKERAATVRLKVALRRHYGYADAKGELVAAVLTGQMPVVGRYGPGIPDLEVEVAQVEAFVARARQGAYAGWLTASVAAKQLDCDPTVVGSLRGRGLLEGGEFATGLRVSEASVEAFRRCYRSLSSLSREEGRSSRALEEVAGATGIALLSVPRQGKKSEQAFIRLEDVERLRAASLRPVVAQPQQDADYCTVTAAAVMLSCTDVVVPQLIRLGHLARCSGPVRDGVSLASLQSFLRQYQAVVKVAKGKGVGSSRVIGEAAAQGMGLLSVPRGATGALNRPGF